MSKYVQSTLLRLAKKHTAYLISFFILILVLSLYSISIRGQEITNSIYDAIRTTESRDEVVIIGIDDKSLQSVGAWPWDRSTFATLTTKLSEAGVRVVVYDVLFFEPRSGDDAFKKALEISTNTSIFSSKIENGVYLSSFLLAQAPTATVSALANVVPDSDGKVRRYSPVYDDGEECLGSLAQTAFYYLSHKEYKKELNCGSQSYFRYPNTVQTYSLIDVIDGKVPEALLKDKVVFIGSTSLGLEDHFVGIAGNKVSGVYIHASMFTSLLNNVDDKPIDPWLTFILMYLGAIMAGSAIYAIKSVVRQVISISVILLSVVISSVVTFSYGYIIPFPWLFGSVLLSSAFTALIRFVVERKQNEKIQTIFSKYVHKDVLKELMVSGSEIKLGGERKKVTVLFSDLRGFTTFSESLTPEALTKLLNGYLSAMTPHILEERGTIDKFIGDAIMAFWNAPLPVHNHAHHAVRSALRMHAALVVFNKEHRTSLAIGIGIHTGNVVVGNVGGRDRVNYTILGDTVNLASRLESLTKRYGVKTLVTEDVKNEITDDSMIFRLLDTITVKGKSEPTKLYEVTEKSSIAARILDDYEKARKAYLKGDWDEAEGLFKKLAHNGDKPSEKMLERIPELRKKESWDGIWRFDEK